VSLEKSKTFVFEEPIKIGEVQYKEVTLRQPSAGELAKAAMEPNSIYTAIALISIIGKIPRKIAEQMLDTDLEDCSDFLGSFTAARAAKRAKERITSADDQSAA
jgi:hypothetical protein